MSFTFNGINSDAKKCIVEKYPSYNRPTRKANAINVQGRNGTLYYDEGFYENVPQIYECYLSAETEKYPSVVSDIADWLYASNDYCELEDSYDTTIFRLARFNGSLSVENIMNNFGRCQISFDCLPQRFLKSGKTEITLGGQIQNLGTQPSKPLYTIEGDGTCYLQIGGQGVYVEVDGYITLDAETQNAYKETINLNSSISGTIPEIPIGTSTVSKSSGFVVKAIPRWWKI